MSISEDADLMMTFPEAEVICTAPDGSKAWHDARRQGIGGSDVAAVLGFVPKYSSPLKVFLEKRGELPKQHRSASLEEAADFGRLMEPIIREQWAKRTGHQFVLAPGTLARPDAPWMRVNLDGVAIEGEGRYGVLECKNRSEYQLGDWEGGIPDPVAVQAMWGMAVTGYGFAHVAAVIGGNKFRTWRIERDEDAIGDLIDLMAEFWHNTAAGIRPSIDSSEATSALLSQIHGVDPAKVTRARRDLIEPLLARDKELRAQKKRVEEELRGVKNRLHDTAGAAYEVWPEDEATDLALYELKPNGTFSVKGFTEAYPDLAALFMRKVEALDTKALAREHPKEYTEHRARVLRVPSPKKSKKRSPR
ncbi:YqaJ viral recombinase family nuclease [Nocardiopsis terrae]|uniref:YqaJ viral recombinase family nuclease n=1 Tax=Streptomyces sp. NPDC057554 TaxID=3350538 RepID=UPI0036B47B9A